MTVTCNTRRGGSDTGMRFYLANGVPPCFLEPVKVDPLPKPSHLEFVGGVLTSFLRSQLSSNGCLSRCFIVSFHNYRAGKVRLPEIECSLNAE